MFDRINNYIKRKSDKEYQHLLKLSKLPRYTKGNFELGNEKYIFPDSASFVFMYKEIFKKEIYKFKSEKKDPFIIDCGANIGMSIIYCKRLFPEAKIIGFEPEKDIFQYLTTNIESRKFKNIELINKAVWDENGKIQFSNEGADGNRISSLHTESHFNDSYEVDAVKLSEYITSHVDFLKLDIEGAEIEVMNEISSKLTLVKNLFIEYHSFEDKPQQLDLILAILTKNNFHYYIDSPNSSTVTPFIKNKARAFLSFDFFLNIYATQKNL